MRVTITTRSVISHGGFDQNGSNVKSLRREPVLVDGDVVMVPCISGNQVRGLVRRKIMKAMLEACDLSRETIDEPGLWDRIYAALVNGGHLEESDMAVKPQRQREIRAALPPLSVLGSAMYRYMLRGRCMFGIAWLDCAETARAGLCTPGAQTLLTCEDMVTETGLARHSEREDADPELSGVTMMPRGVEVIAANVKMTSRIAFDPEATEIERSAIAWGLSRISRVGGLVAAGFGSVDVACDPATDEQGFASWIDGLKREKDGEFILNVFRELGTVSVKPAKKKRGRPAKKESE